MTTEKEKARIRVSSDTWMSFHLLAGHETKTGKVKEMRLISSRFLLATNAGTTTATLQRLGVFNVSINVRFAVATSYRLYTYDPCNRLTFCRREQESEERLSEQLRNAIQSNDDVKATLRRLDHNFQGMAHAAEALKSKDLEDGHNLLMFAASLGMSTSFDSLVDAVKERVECRTNHCARIAVLM